MRGRAICAPVHPDCFAEPVLGPASGRTRGLAMMAWDSSLRGAQRRRNLGGSARYVQPTAPVTAILMLPGACDNLGHLYFARRATNRRNCLTVPARTGRS